MIRTPHRRADRQTIGGKGVAIRYPHRRADKQTISWLLPSVATMSMMDIVARRSAVIHANQTPALAPPPASPPAAARSTPPLARRLSEGDISFLRLSGEPPPVAGLCGVWMPRKATRLSAAVMR